ncbi:MAG: NUDIX domain-containing protein [Candidatus Uhrbacteria bacterium]
MSEQINTYLLEEPDKAIAMDRAEFYREQVQANKETGGPTRANEVVQICIFNEAGELFVQKRSNEKTHNPGLLDKSIGGHVQDGDSADYTVMVETIQELQVPSIVLQSTEDFNKTYKLLREYLNTISIIEHIDSKFEEMLKVINGENVVIANKFHLYFGVYGGRIKTVDQEAKGILQYSLDDLEAEMIKFPDVFTQDLQFFVKEYKEQMQKFLKQIN